MMQPLAEDEREAFIAMIGRVRTWVQEGYVQEIGRRYPEVAARNQRARKPAG
jgi:hypothetical protein